MSLNESLTVKSLRKHVKNAQMAIFCHKLMAKKNVQLLSSGQLLIPIGYLEAPLPEAYFLV